MEAADVTYWLSQHFFALRTADAQGHSENILIINLTNQQIIHSPMALKYFPFSEALSGT